jgi:hypothetical protein
MSEAEIKGIAIMRVTKKLVRSQSGIALLTTILLMLLMSSLLVGFVLLINSGQKLAGTNNDYSKAFYAAEAGMEKLTADLGTLFNQNYSPNGVQIQALTTTPPVLSGISYVKATGGSGYTITTPAANTDVNGNPVATVLQITAGPYQGMTALATPYTLDVSARTSAGSEVKLERTTQTVGIPMFQFGVFSDSDLSFFPGPNFNFGGRTHTNGNLFLASGSTLTLSDRVTAVKDIIRYTLENGHLVSSGYTGTVNVFNGAGTRSLATSEGSLTMGLGSPADSNWSNISLGASYYAGNMRNGTTGARNLQLGIVTLGAGTTQAVDVIRRPAAGESSTVTQERYFAQASIKILLSDNAADLEGAPTGAVPCTTPTVPFDLRKLAAPYATLQASTDPQITAIRTALGTNLVPLATSGAVSSTGYTASTVTTTTPFLAGDGYWLPAGNPIITGYLKIEVQTPPYNACSFTDITTEVLGRGYVGKNANPIGGVGVPISPILPALPTTQQPSLNSAAATPDPCPDPHPGAIIRLERIRDNPFTGGTAGNGFCGLTGTNIVATQQSDYWPNTLFDVREGLIRDVAPTGTLNGLTAINNVNYSTMVTLGGVMQYVEVDVKNLAKYLAGISGGSGHNSHDPNVAPNNYVLYVSDRRGNYVSAPTNYAGVWPPKSPSGNETGEYGFNDIVNLTDPTNGCPNATLDTGEDLDGTGLLYIYGQDPGHTMSPLSANPAQPQLGGYGPWAGLYNGTGVASPNGNAFANPQIGTGNNCGIANPSGVNVWARTFVIHANEARENPNFLFRRAVKLVNGSDLIDNLDACPGGVTCGLTVASENPVYIQGSYNCPGCAGGFNTSDVGASVIGDSVTLLSDSWNDVNSFINPYALTIRVPVGSYWRTAIVGGKGVYFPQPAGSNQDFGTDGGVHNFLRYLENWSNIPVYYDGSLVSLYFNRQGTGVYKCCNTVYSAPVRNYSFDTNFLQPQLLPPRTPLFRDINTTGFTQLLGPTQ